MNFLLALMGCAAMLLIGGGAWGSEPKARRPVPLDLMAVAKRAPNPADRGRTRAATTRRKETAAAKETYAAREARLAREAGVTGPIPAEENDDTEITGAINGKDGSGSPQSAAGGKPGGGTKPAAKPRPGAAPENDTALFCTNVSDAAADARLAWQMKELQKAEGQLRERIAELEAKRAEYESWLKLREDFLKKAEDSVVEIYSRMRSDAAALQIAAMSDDTAAAVLAKLTPRSASTILNEMEPARAAFLANTLAGMRRTTTEKASK